MVSSALGGTGGGDGGGDELVKGQGLGARARRASLPLLSSQHSLPPPGAATATDGGGSKASIRLEVLSADKLMPAKKGSASRDKHGNVVADRKPCLRVSLYLPGAGTAFGRGAGGADDDDAGDDTDPRGTSTLSASFAAQGQGDLRRVQSCHRDFAEVTLNPRFNSSSNNNGGAFELSLPCPRRVVQKALLASRSVSSSSTSSTSSSSPSPFLQSGAAAAAAHDAASKALLDYWAQGLLKIQVVDGDRFNEDIFLGEVSLLLSTFLVPSRRHSVTCSHANGHRTGLVGGADVYAHAAPGATASRAPLVVEGTYPMAKLRPGDRVSGTLTLRAALHLPDAAQLADLLDPTMQGVGASPPPLRAASAPPGDGEDDGNDRPPPPPPELPALPVWEEEEGGDDEAFDTFEPLELAPACTEGASRSRSVFDARATRSGLSPTEDAEDGAGESEWDAEETDVLEVSFAPSSPKVTESPDRRRFRLRPAVSSFTQHGHHGQQGGTTDMSIALVKSRVRVRPTTMAAKDEEACADGAPAAPALSALGGSDAGAWSPATPKASPKEKEQAHPASPTAPQMRAAAQGSGGRASLGGGRASLGSTASPGGGLSHTGSSPCDASVRRSMIADVTRCLDSLAVAQENADDVLSRLQRRIDERQAAKRRSSSSPAKDPDDSATLTTAAADDTTTLTADDEDSLVNLTPVLI